MKLPARISSERLVIRPFQEKDFSAFRSFMMSEEATRYLLFTNEDKTDHGIREIFDNILNSYKKDKPIFSLAVVRIDNDDKFIGSVGLASDFNGVDLQIYWSILPEYWNNGYATEAVTTIVDYAFYELGTQRIIAYSHPDNAASIKVAKKVGFENKGLQFVADLQTNAVICEIVFKQ